MDEIHPNPIQRLKFYAELEVPTIGSHALTPKEL